jgi:uncharacterized protein
VPYACLPAKTFVVCSVQFQESNLNGGLNRQIPLVGLGLNRLMGPANILMSSSRAMRLGIVSDTHGLVRPALMGANGVDEILHAGDVGDQEVLAILETLAPVRAVRGNVDGPDLPESLEFELAGQHFAMAHGHLFEAKNRQTFILDDHTHVPVLEVIAGITVINSGSAGSSRILEVGVDSYSWELLDLEA